MDIAIHIAQASQVIPVAILKVPKEDLGDHEARRVIEVHQGVKDLGDPRVRMAVTVSEDLEDIRERMVVMVSEDPVDIRERMVVMVVVDLKVRRVSEDPEDTGVRTAVMAVVDLKVKEVTEDLKVSEDLEDTRARTDVTVVADPKVKEVTEEKTVAEAHQDAKDPKVIVVAKVIVALVDHQDPPENEDLEDPPALVLIPSALSAKLLNIWKNVEKSKHICIYDKTSK